MINVRYLSHSHNAYLFSYHTFKRQHSGYAWVIGIVIRKLIIYKENIKLSRKLEDSFFLLSISSVLWQFYMLMISSRRLLRNIKTGPILMWHCLIICNDQSSVIRIVHVHFSKSIGMKNQVGNDRNLEWMRLYFIFVHELPVESKPIEK